MTEVEPRGDRASRARQAADDRRNGGTGAEVVPANRKDAELRKLLKAFEPEIIDQLPGHMKVNVKAFMRMVLTGLKSSRQAEALMACDRPSLYGALLESARYGLTPFTDEAAVVPFGKTATFIPMAQGFIRLFWNSGQICGVVVDFIRKGEVRGADWDITRGQAVSFYHKPRLIWEDDDGNPCEPGEPVIAYCYLEFKDGSVSPPALVTRWDAEDVMRNRSRAWANAEKYKKYDSLWHTDFPAMWLKMLHVETPVPTPSGWSTMGDLQPGDVVFDRDGQPTPVVACSQVKTDSECYRISFTSGEPVIAGADHYWVARIGGSHRRPGVHTTADMYAAKQAGRQVVLPVAGALDLPAADLPVDPWVLGYWLGNGHRGGGQMSCHGEDGDGVAEMAASAGYPVSVRPQAGKNASVIGLRGLAKPLADLGVLGDKHVPAVYLRGSAGQRLALLRGLMDSDGTFDKTRRRVSFCSARRHLRDAVAELARSLGEQVVCFENDSTGFGKTVRAYQVTWGPLTEVPFALSRKASQVPPRKAPSYGHRVKSIEPVASVPTRCIAVDSPTRTYLAGTAMVPTHNTAVRRVAKYGPKSAELQELLLIEAREDRTRDDARPAQRETLPADRGIDWTVDVEGGKVIDGDGVIVKDGAGEDGGEDDSGWPEGFTREAPGNGNGGQDQDQGPPNGAHRGQDDPAAPPVIDEIGGLFAQCGMGGKPMAGHRLVCAAALSIARKTDTPRPLPDPPGMAGLTVRQADQLARALRQFITDNPKQADRRARLKALSDRLSEHWAKVAAQDQAGQDDAAS